MEAIVENPSSHLGISEQTKQEIANSVTHGIGALMAIGALVLLVVFASLRGTARHVVGASLFGSALVLLYVMSTIYHALRAPRAKAVFKVLDHSAIFLLIAGTYTPFCLATLRGAWGWTIFGLVWGLATLGITFKSIFIHRMKSLSTAIYLLMGWIVLIALVPLCRALSVGGLMWLFGGGLCYSLGAVIYSRKSWRFHHAIWHLFVMAGSLCHFFAVLWHVIPAPK
jgi:hemolysin III